MFPQNSGGGEPYTVTVISELILSANSNIIITTPWSAALAFTVSGGAFALTSPTVIYASYRNMATAEFQAQLKGRFIISGTTGAGSVMYFIPSDVTCDYYRSGTCYSRVSGNIQMYSIS